MTERHLRGAGCVLGPMRRLLIASGLVAALLASGCGQAAPRPAGGTATTQRSTPPATLTFARPPSVVLTSSGLMTTAVRTTRALPVSGLGIGATLETTGADPNRGSQVERIPGYRRCYAKEAPVAAGRRLLPGTKVTVKLRAEEGAVVSARVPLRSAASATRGARRVSAARSLGCMRGTPEQRCTGSVAGNGLEIAIERALGGASCATARAVFGQVATWMDARRCFQDLCVKQHRMNRGFRCAVAKVGEANWTITCRRGKQSVRGSTAE
jgi:hypothetical protein